MDSEHQHQPDIDPELHSGSHDASDHGSDDENVFSLSAQKLDNNTVKTTKNHIRKPRKNHSPATIEPSLLKNDEPEGEQMSLEDPQARRRRLLEEKMDLAMKSKSTRRKRADEDDLERMQDDRIDELKDQMIKAANMDVEKNSQGQIATEKLKLLPEVSSVLLKADLAISILDNNLLEAVRLWLEPLPDASMPAYQIQKELIHALTTLPIKTDHLVASGIGKVLVFYQRSKRTEPLLKQLVDRLIGDWTRPILNKSDSYKDRTIQFQEYNSTKYANKLPSSRVRAKEPKTLYEQSAERRKRAAIPSARTSAYKIAPRVDPNLIRRQKGGPDERFRSINLKLSLMDWKKKLTSRKGGPSIEGKNLAM